MRRMRMRRENNGTKKEREKKYFKEQSVNVSLS